MAQQQQTQAIQYFDKALAIDPNDKLNDNAGGDDGTSNHCGQGIERKRLKTKINLNAQQDIPKISVMDGVLLIMVLNDIIGAEMI